jgi:hypothetical protein
MLLRLSLLVCVCVIMANAASSSAPNVGPVAKTASMTADPKVAYNATNCGGAKKGFCHGQCFCPEGTLATGGGCTFSK